MVQKEMDQKKNSDRKFILSPYIQGMVVPLVAAALGAIAGAWYAGDIALDRWRLTQAVESYDRLIRAADAGLFKASRIKWEYSLARNAVEHGLQADASKHLFRAFDANQEVISGSSDFIVGSLVLEALGIQDYHVTSKWRQQYVENLHNIVMNSGLYTDSLQVVLAEARVVLAEARMDSLRLNLIESAKRYIKQESE